MGRERPIAALQETSKPFRPKKPNKKLLERQGERAIESKVYDLQCELEDKGMNEDLIKMRCSELRETLRRRVANGESLAGEQDNKDSHRIALLQQKKNEIMRKALNISSGHRRGEGFDQALQEEKKEARLKERLENEEQTLESKLEELNRHPLDRRNYKKKDDGKEDTENARKGPGDRRRNREDEDRGARWVKNQDRRDRYRDRDRNGRRGGRDRDRDRGRRDRRRDGDRRRRSDERRDGERKQRSRRRGEKRALESPSPPRKRMKRSEEKRHRSPSNSAEAMPVDNDRWSSNVDTSARVSISGERDSPPKSKKKKEKKRKRKYKLRQKSERSEERKSKKTRDNSFDKELEQHLREQETKKFKKKLQEVNSAPEPAAQPVKKETRKPEKKKKVKEKPKKVEEPSSSSSDSDSDSDSSD